MSPVFFSDVRLVAPDDPGYRAFVRRIREARAPAEPARAEAARAAPPAPAPAADRPPPAPPPARDAPPPPPGEVGKRVERAVRQWLGLRLKLERDTVLTWRRRAGGDGGGWERRYAELDAVSRLDYDTLLVCEIKFTTEARMRLRAGADQLDRAASLLSHTRAGRRVLRRFVYVGAGGLELPGLPALPPRDADAPAGVIWVEPGEVARIAAENGCPLPPGWCDKSPCG